MNYKETIESGQVWTRCYRVEIVNPLDRAPSVNMFEETVISIAGQSITRPGRMLQKMFQATDVVQLVNPATGEPLGASMTHQELYIALYSLWLATAQEHDAAEQAFQPIPEVQAEDIPPEPTPEPTPE